jgi:hypothetical protein
LGKKNTNNAHLVVTVFFSVPAEARMDRLNQRFGRNAVVFLANSVGIF